MLEDRLEVGGLDHLAALAAGEAQILLDQLGHLADILAEPGQHRVVALSEQLELELHAGQGRAQVVADGGQHLGTLADVAQDAVAHQVEGVGGLADLQGPRGQAPPTSRPLPKLSARASWRIGRTCRRRKKIEIAEDDRAAHHQARGARWCW